LKKDGETVVEGDVLVEIKGSTKDILKGERTALNFLQRLSGIATRTQQYVAKIKDYSVRITDTRKTTPNLRILEKYAVTAGGGYNHRMGLYDAVMIKDNHIKAAGGIKKAVKIIKENIPHTTSIEVEVEDMNGVKETLESEVDIIMLDNMTYRKMKNAVDYIRKEDKKMIIEASGGITLENVETVAETGVDIISIGALTHQINSLDISLDLTPDINQKKEI
ncbi:MAG: carboxylating nicotinate-nucleotide diphosphorylase, partial [Bacillota bacterium]